MSTVSKSKVTATEPLDPKDARWVKLVKLTYTDPTATVRTWESAERLTRPHGSAIDGVGIIAIMQNDPAHPSAPPRILLQKQFRPPIDQVVIEVPAGLIDAGETAEACALRELREETGYRGRVVEGFGMTPVQWNDPGFCNTNVQMIHVTVDMSLPENQNPKPELEESEFIECFTVPMTDLYAESERLEREGYAIDARVGTFAEGIEVAKRWKLV
ncbi:putative ADP-ribose pyrophosphatase [Mytilinidion resinicola]|uniref:ADP-ribose pyrophosphatase n=1 Tax=Mytilinidion resinicola TaxID=574789 RepID=A0A6A6YLI5_9PEZI|nr:putative ADP-ribose pyrophosphatase [Mytilinidion resinicola]KAF2808844.1 putative ADP-ribose pyrophosphatase [Mytilinidion resinicola]